MFARRHWPPPCSPGPDRAGAPAGPAGRRGRHGRGVLGHVRGRRGADRAGAARAVDLDAECVLYGQLEDILWLAPASWADLADPAVWADLPREVVALGPVTLICVAGVTLFYKELKLTSFDPDLATTLGISGRACSTSACCRAGGGGGLASFEAVGSILVIAMFICPAAAARLLTDRLPVQLWLSVVIGGVAGAGGYLLGAFGPRSWRADRPTR